MIIDTHIHLDDERYMDDFVELYDRAKDCGVGYFIIPGAHPSTLSRAIELSEKYSDIYFALGAHPYDMDRFYDINFDTLVKHPKCIAIGECGLDYYRLEGSEEEIALEKAKQADIFKKHIEIAKKYNKPLIVHIREASHDSKEILLSQGAGEVGGVLHCYNADHELLSLAKHNFYFGIGGVVTFKNARKLVEVLPKIPLDRVVLETDGPYLTPHPHRGMRNESSYLPLISSKIAEILEKKIDDIENITTQNAKRLFKLE